MAKKSVLFICLGNICRSPISEALFVDLLEKKGERDSWKVDSAAIIDMHVGKNPDKRTTRTLQKNGITSYSHKCRQIRTADFSDFDYIVGMDDDNMGDLNDLKPKNCRAKLVMFGDYDTDGSKTYVEDPYYSDDIQAFQDVYDKVYRCCRGFYDSVTS
ncbi:low molecular weight phosphotyrosine protein phosphatase-like [Saccostrea cucullata]|uniref:low molecular weight phosphotyrosine protein phosphatase-like n=1 Tax=Saccostrea cuccullata TaxID=36930 RepID=UPI002ED2B39F